MVGRTFAEYVEEALNTTRACLARADLYEKQQQPAGGSGVAPSDGGAGGGGAAELVGYGRGMSMAQWMRFQCYHANGWVGGRGRVGAVVTAVPCSCLRVTRP